MSHSTRRPFSLRERRHRIRRTRDGGPLLAALLLVSIVAAARRPARADTGEPAANPLPLPTAVDTADTAVRADSTADSAGRAAASLDTMRYEAEVIKYDKKRNMLYLEKNAVVYYQDLILQADTITYFIDNDLFVATGFPRLIEGRDTTLGETMLYNAETRRGRVQYANTTMEGSFYKGKNIIKTRENDIYVDQGDFTTCAVIDSPHYHFYGKDIKIIPNDKVMSRPIVFNIADVPVGVLPYFVFPIERGRRSGFLTPGWGGHPGSGGYVDNVGYYWAPNDYMDCTVKGRLQEFQDVVLTAESQYRLKYWFDGRVSGRYTQSERFERREQRWSLDYSHNQNITPDGATNLSGSGSLVSDRDFYREFSEDTSELVNQTIRANMTLNRRFESINASGRITWDRTHNLTTDERTEQLPSASFSLPSRPILPSRPRGDPAGAAEDGEDSWYNRIYASYNARGVNRRGFDGMMMSRMGTTQSVNLSSPQTLLRYFTINPDFSIQLSSFDACIDTFARDTLFIRDTLFDTLTAAAFDTLDTTRTDTAVSRFAVLTTNDTLGNPDTSYVIRRIPPLQRVPFFDTTLNDWRHDISWNTGVNLSTTLYGLFPIRLFNLAGIRHVVTPSIGYRFTPEHSQRKRFFPIGIPYRRGGDRSQTLGLSIGNQFQGKIVEQPRTPGGTPRERKFNILSGSVSTSYDFEAETRRWSDLSVSASTYWRFLNFSYSSAFWLYDGQGSLALPILRSYGITLSMGNMNVSGRLWDGDVVNLKKSLFFPQRFDYEESAFRRWSIGISPSYSYSASRASPADVFVPTKNYNLRASAGLGFTSKWQARWGGYYNFAENQLVGHSFNFTCDLECWDMRFDWQPSGYNPGYYFIIAIKKLPEIKWEKRD